MPKLRSFVTNDKAPSHVNEVRFSPDGRILAATLGKIDEVRLYDAATLSLIRTLKNPGSMLDQPHGIWMTNRHVIVTNTGKKNTRLLVFRLDDDSGVPVQCFPNPFGHLAEGHSMALHGRRLVVTFCENREKKGAIVSYDYDDEVGRITGPVDIEERWFRRYGDAKGVCFNGAGDRVYVTFESGNWDNPRLATAFANALKNKLTRGLLGRTWRNGIVVFGVDPSGRFSSRPLKVNLFNEFVRLENIHVHDNRAVVTNPVGGCVYFYDLDSDPDFKAPSDVLSEGLVFPHGVRISPDGRTLVVSDFGLKVVNRRIYWDTYVSPRRDQLAVYDLQAG